MRTNFIAAIVTAGTLFGLQSAAFAQTGLGYIPERAEYGNTQTTSPWAQPYWQGRAGATPQYYDYYVSPRRVAPGTPRLGQQN